MYLLYPIYFSLYSFPHPSSYLLIHGIIKYSRSQPKIPGLLRVRVFWLFLHKLIQKQRFHEIHLHLSCWKHNPTGWNNHCRWKRGEKKETETSIENAEDALEVIVSVSAYNLSGAALVPYEKLYAAMVSICSMYAKTIMDMSAKHSVWRVNQFKPFIHCCSKTLHMARRSNNQYPTVNMTFLQM